MAYRILVVEDEADTREVLTILLGLDAHLVDTAENGPEALELLARRSYDVILTNLHMPGMSGEDLYRRIGEVLHYVWDPIGVSGYPEARDEYDMYLPQVFSLAIRGASADETAAGP